jgi:hypothetical protein
MTIRSRDDDWADGLAQFLASAPPPVTPELGSGFRAMQDLESGANLPVDTASLMRIAHRIVGPLVPLIEE